MNLPALTASILTVCLTAANPRMRTTVIIEQAIGRRMEVVIPPKKNRKEGRQYDRDLYKLRHLVENAFLHLKRWLGIATRYAKNSFSFLPAVQIRCIALWTKIL